MARNARSTSHGAAARNWFGRTRRGWSISRQLFVLQVVVVAVVVLAGAGLAYVDAQQRTEDAAHREVIAIAQTLAQQPDLRNAVTTPTPSATLQPLAERVRAETGVDFVVVMSVDGIRYTHPNPAEIGRKFLGHIDQAQAGELFTETYEGTLGPSVRAVAPVFDGAGRVTALVAVGITLKVITSELRAQIAALVMVAVVALLLGALLTYVVTVRLRRHTHGLRPAELSRMYEYHDAILHAVREGLLLVSPSGQLTLCNDGAAALLSLDRERAEGCHVSELGLPGSLARTLISAEPVRDKVHVTDDRVLVVNVSPIRSRGRDLGSVVTLRDHTELQALTGELDSMRGFAESLRAQAHESANRLHTVVSLIELGRIEEAIEFATAELELAQHLTDRVVGAVKEPVLAAVLLGKSADARQRGVEVVLTEDSVVSDAVDGHIEPREFVTILGNLIDNAIEAALEAGSENGRPRVFLTVRSNDGELMIRVADTGRGLDPEMAQRVFQRGWSTKGDQRGLGLALVGQSIRRCGGRIEVASDGGAVFTVHLPSTVDRAGTV